MRIGIIAKQVGITVEAIRFYEKQSLIKPPGRNESGYRDYPEDAVDHISFIRRAKELGFSLKEIKELMALQSTPGTSCGAVKEQAQAKIVDIDLKMADLARIKKNLLELVSACPGQGPLSSCPIIGPADMKGKDNE